MFVSELQRPYLYVPGISVISDSVIRCVQGAPDLPE